LIALWNNRKKDLAELQLIDPQFFYDLKSLTELDLSQAHLRQHFTSAELYLQKANLSLSSHGTWSSQKKLDTATYSNGYLTGKKYWISGISLCEWAIVAVKNNNTTSLVLFDPANAVVEPVLTSGMEDTLTTNLTFNQTPAIFLYHRQDPVCFSVDSHSHLSFLTIQLGLMESLLRDIDLHTGSQFDYEKKKLSVDVDVMKILWQQEIETINYSYRDQQRLWDRRSLIYAFGKKSLTSITNFVTEATGSGLFDPHTLGHQRYKDALIYCSHMHNVSSAVNFFSKRKKTINNYATPGSSDVGTSTDA
jgi:rhodanese-related sulfurtransferase